MIRRVVWLVGVLGLVLAQAALAQEQGGTVNLYTSNNAEVVETLIDVAHERAPLLKINVVYGGSVTLMKRIEAEARAPKADVFWAASASVLDGFKSVLTAYRSPQSSAIPAQYVEPHGLWTVCNVHVAVLMLNTRQLGSLPRPLSWSDLTDPRFKGKIIVVDPNTTSTGHMILWGVSKLLGAKEFRALARNVTVARNSAFVSSSVGQGEYAVGLTFEANAYPYVAGGQKEIELVYPKDGTFVSEESAAMVRNAPHAAAARVLYDLLLSRALQVELLRRAFRRPGRDDIAVGRYVGLAPLNELKTVPIDEDEAREARGRFLARWREVRAGLDGG
jgi:iron(III) transport system substrate-binding protein